MRAVTLILSSREETNRRFVQAFEEESQGSLISFESPALLFKVLTGKRWEMLKLMTGAGPMSIREAARKARKGRKGGSWRCESAVEHRHTAKDRQRPYRIPVRRDPC